MSAVLSVPAILDLPRRFRPVIQAVADCQAAFPHLWADLFLVACGGDGTIVARAGAPHLLHPLTDQGIAPGYRAGWLAQHLAGGRVALRGGLWARAARLEGDQGLYVLLGGRGTAGEAVAAHLLPVLAAHVAQRARWHQEEFARHEFALQRAKLQAFYELTSELSALAEPGAILEAVARQVTEFLEAGTTLIYGHNPAQTRLVPLAGYQIPADQLRSVRYEVELGDNLIARVYRTGNTMRVEDVAASGDPGMAALRELGLRSVLLMPVRLQDRPLGVMVVGRYVPRPFAPDHAEILAFVAHQIALTLENARLRARLAQQLSDIDRDLALARGMQALMLPEGPLRARHVAVAGATWPAKHLGGDYFDYFIHRRTLYAMVADIMGKGVSAALLLSILRSHFRRVFQRGARLTLATANRLAEMVHHDFKPQRAFTTALVLALDLETLRLAVLCAGHPPPLLYRGGGVAAACTARAPALGLKEGPLPPEAVQAVPLQPGDVVLAYTDGATDLLGPGGQRYGRERLQAAFARSAATAAGPEALLAALRAELDAFATQQPDDTTLLAVWVGAAAT